MRIRGHRAGEFRHQYDAGLVPIYKGIADKMMLEDGCSDAPFSYKTELGSYRTVLRINSCVIHIEPQYVRVTESGLETLPMPVFIAGLR